MPRNFTSKEAKLCLQKTQQLLSQTQSLPGIREALEGSVKSAAEAMADAAALELLSQIPVEELNREKRGFRTALLREIGCHTIADLMAVSQRTIADINGISDESACAIKEAAGQLAAQARQGVRIRLSTDRKTEAATGLVTALSRLKHCLSPLDTCTQLCQAHRERITWLTADLKPGTGSLKWLFASAGKKTRAENAYAVLSQEWSGGVLSEMDALVQAVQQQSQRTAADAWADYEANSIQLLGLLEQVVPGILGAEDGIYGLPEELAREIQQEVIHTDGLQCTLRRYQEWGVKYILHQQRVLLGDEMGLGKTIQAIAAMVSLKNTGATHFAVVCPASVISNWCREIRKHSDLPVIKVHGQDRAAALAAWVQTGGVAVTTYETTGFFQLAEDFRFSMLTVDEAHYIKNPEARRTIHVKKIAAHAQRLLFMTGTALENRVEEMICLMQILQPQVAESVQSMLSLSAAPQFREKVAPVYYRRRREDVLTELPELTEAEEWCTLGTEEEAAYESAILARNYVLARRVSWCMEDLSKSSKAQRLLELVEEAEDDGRKVIVFSFFLDTIGKAARLLGDRCSSPITGSVPPHRRQEILDEFAQAPAGSVLLAQIQSGGTGLNIQSASVVVICEPQFKPSIENQAISRAYRMGQTRDVLVYRLLCEDTVDERIRDILEAKQKLFDAFADESAVAQESQELDNESFGKIITEEIARIQKKQEADTHNETAFALEAQKDSAQAMPGLLQN